MLLFSDLSQPRQSAYRGRNSEGLKIPVVDFSREAGCAEGIKSCKFVQINGKSIWTDRTMKRDNHLACLTGVHSLDASH